MLESPNIDLAYTIGVFERKDLNDNVCRNPSDYLDMRIHTLD